MTDLLDICDFAVSFEDSIARHRDFFAHAPDLLPMFRDAAHRGDVEAVACLAGQIRTRIRRERLWHLESLATARGQDARRQRFHDLAWGHAA